MTKFDYSQLFYHQCNKSLVSLLLWFSFIFGPWYKELYVKASLLKKLTGIHANNCYNFICLFWTLTHPYNISSSGWTRNYSSMSLSVGRSRDDRYRINDERILPLRSSLTTLVVRSWMMAQRNLPGFCCTFRVFVVFIKAVAVSFFVRRGCLTRKTINSLFGAISLKNRRWIDGKRVKKTASVGNNREAHEKWFKTFNSAEASWSIYVSSTPRVSNSWINGHISASVVFSAALSICQTSS